MKIWTDDTDVVIAEDLADARAVIVELYGSAEFFEVDGWREVSGDHPITITMEDAPAGEETRTQTAREWAEENGRGLLCSTEF